VPADWFERFRRELSPSGSASPIRAMHAVRAVTHAAEAIMDGWLAPHGLSLGRFNVLICLWGAPGLARPMSDLRRAVISSPAHATKLVGQLEAAGLVRREADPADGRGVLARLTPAGEARVAAVAPAHVARIEVAMAGLAEAEFGRLVELLGRVRSGFARAAAGDAERTGAGRRNRKTPQT